jgi:hypothetical protein
LIQYLDLWDILNGVELNEEIPDKHILRLFASGKYTAKSTYHTLFQGAIFFEPYERIWKFPNANFPCGWSLKIDAGQRTDWQRGGSFIQDSAFYVIKRRTFKIFLWAVYSQETFGSPSCRALVLQHLLLSLLTNPLIIGGAKMKVLLVEICS